MDIIDTLNISSSGLTAQRIRLQATSTNMANARTTRTADGSHFQRRAPVFEAQAINSFGSALDREMASVEVTDVHVYNTEGIRRFDPQHPDADEEGFVTYPDINILHEMVDMMSAARAYEANTKAVDVTLQMARKALEIAR
jgi:flagellar basal-body rod protein FlgC